MYAKAYCMVERTDAKFRWVTCIDAHTHTNVTSQEPPFPASGPPQGYSTPLTKQKFRSDAMHAILPGRCPTANPSGCMHAMHLPLMPWVGCLWVWELQPTHT